MPFYSGRLYIKNNTDKIWESYHFEVFYDKLVKSPDNVNKAK